MRMRNACWRWLFALAAMGTMFGSIDGCLAQALRDVADDLDQFAYQLDGEPQTLGQWWDNIWSDDGSHRDEEEEDLGDWWDDLWD